MAAVSAMHSNYMSQPDAPRFSPSPADTGEAATVATYAAATAAAGSAEVPAAAANGNSCSGPPESPDKAAGGRKKVGDQTVDELYASSFHNQRFNAYDSKKGEDEDEDHMDGC